MNSVDTVDNNNKNKQTGKQIDKQTGKIGKQTSKQIGNTLTIHKGIKDYINTSRFCIFDIITASSILTLCGDILWLTHDIGTNGLNNHYLIVGILLGISQVMNILVLGWYHISERDKYVNTIKQFRSRTPSHCDVNCKKDLDSIRKRQLMSLVQED